MTTRAMPNIDAIRERFPALSRDLAFLENAGGSQVPDVVANGMRDYMLENYVQLGAGYKLSQHCTRLVDEAHQFIKLFMGGMHGHVAFGSSCTVLCHMLADCYSGRLDPGAEVVVAESGHEANVGPWIGLERYGVRVKMWRVDPATGVSTMDGLRDVLSAKTKIVAFPHVSNLLGEIVDVEEATRIAHEVGAHVVVDGVAYAPHRAMAVEDWDVDWYVYSTYKVYGPHMAALWGKPERFADLTGPNHFFIPDDEVPYKFELGGASHEGCAGLIGLEPYLNYLAGKDEHLPTSRQTVLEAFDLMEELESPLQRRLIEYLQSKPTVRIIGPDHAEHSRVGTISFVHESKSSKAITQATDEAGIAIRHGHMYAYRLCQALGFKDVEDGVVRVSMVHYNTMEEIERLIGVLETVL